MKIFTTATSTLFISCCLLIQDGNAYSLFKNSVPTTKASATDEIETTSRRNLLRAAAALSAGALLGNINPAIALAADDVATPVYFGVGVSSDAVLPATKSSIYIRSWDTFCRCCFTVFGFSEYFSTFSLSCFIWS